LPLAARAFLDALERPKSESQRLRLKGRRQLSVSSG
jgi:hypothetical protein